MKKISIIIPFYNSEKTVQYCLKSIIEQTYDAFEVICINDGSTDNTKEVLNEISNKDKRIKVTTKENGGAATARNLGLQLASGDYVTFIDSDDYIDKDYLETLVEAVDGCSIVVSGYKKVNEHFEVLYKKTPKTNPWSAFKFSATWGKLYQREILTTHTIEFENFRLGEDLVFLSKFLRVSKSINAIPYCGYNYMYNNESLTNTIAKVQKINSCTPLLARIREIFVDEDDKVYQRRVYYFLVKTSVFNIFSQRNNMNHSEMENEFKNNLNEIAKSYPLYFMWQKGEEFLVNILVNWFIFSYKSNLLKIFFKFFSKKYE